MKLSKYIIRNCPSYNKDYSCQSKDNITGKYCQDCTDCAMKQIVELCKPLNTKQPESYYNLEILLAKKVLQLLDIKEVK